MYLYPQEPFADICSHLSAYKLTLPTQDLELSIWRTLQLCKFVDIYSDAGLHISTAFLSCSNQESHIPHDREAMNPQGQQSYKMKQVALIRSRISQTSFQVPDFS